jgi:uncharacterized protein (TIRG00374 family)
MRFWIKLTVGLALCGLLLQHVDWRGTLDALRHAEIRIVLLALLALGMTIPLSTWKWWVLLCPRDIEAGFGQLLRAYWAGNFFSNFLPSSIGGDIVRLVALRGRGGTPEIAASILLERLTGLAILVPLAAHGLLRRPDYFGPPGLTALLELVVAGLGAAMLLLWLGARYLPQRLEPLSGRARFFGALLARKLVPFVGAVAFYRSRPREVLTALALSVPFYAFLILFQYLLFHAVGAPLPLGTVALVAPMIPLVALLPLTPNGLGIVEGAFVLFYVQAGAAPEVALAAALLRRLATLAVSLVGGLLWIAGRFGAATLPSEASKLQSG